MTIRNLGMTTVNDIYQFGDHFELNRSINVTNMLNELEPFKNYWSQYNPRKNINRQGLCVLNDKGSVGPGPALDSLYEYNKENNTNIGETDCNIPTELFFESAELKNSLTDIIPWSCRTHFLRLGSGGFFPTHRDHKFGIQNTFRIIVPIKNCNAPQSFFMIEDRILNWNYGKFYIVNTTKAHTLFNASMNDSLWLIINSEVCTESVDFVCNNLSIN